MRWVELQRLERGREAASKINVALQVATGLRGQARHAAVGDLAPWKLAVVAAGKARDLLVPGVDPGLRKTVDDLAADVAVERQQAETKADLADRDKRLIVRLDDIRLDEADDPGGWSTDSAYDAAFREWGLDVAALSAEQAAKRIQARPPEVVTTLATAVDDWAAIRRDRKKNHAGAAALSALAERRRSRHLAPRTSPCGRLAQQVHSPGESSTSGQGRADRDAGAHQPRPPWPGPQGRG